ncbi:hypothetical protein [Bernardetia sp.]|uniref:hypothetical protein n=1 Tax=Bernardetia sp. TaxID=1937974 RepID=UPI0025B85F61|nr:hypothetical protein [Bernardetia sp.]
MAISKKGLRTIIVNDKKYHWKFNEKVFIVPSENEDNLLIVDFGWYDVLEPSRKNAQIDFYPKIATPKFVERSILFAVDNEWNEEIMELKYREGNYSLIK